jgi:hypothetical protein
MKLLCLILGHNVLVTKWGAITSMANTKGNYEKLIGLIVEDCICTRCEKILEIKVKHD